ncbi:MAG: ACT domain-containing protein [Lachnospiraceae bacterium]|nr:ACT domain-containing protein [Lachnospiraceae bacterium]MBR2531217.1 ACT domain-containing protein [Lachnospiraceae bacterium]
MDIKQISVFLENKPGTLNDMTRVLTEHNVDLRALSLAETTDFGIARFIVGDVLDTVNILKEAGYVSSLTPVVVAEVEDEPGALNKVLQVFTDHSINVEYMYAMLGSREGKAYMIFRVQDSMKATGALLTNGIRILDQESLSEL